LTDNGISQVKGTGEALVGPGKLIDPSKLAHVFTSPRQRAVVTLDMLLGPTHKDRLEKEGKVTVTEDITEWDYGSYEGLKPHEIKESRAERGLPKWDIWTMGCEGGE
jgi:broad specificity phosphatase PhoE